MVGAPGPVHQQGREVRSRVRVGDGYSEEFGVGIGVHQGSSCPQPTSLHHCVRGSIKGAPCRLSMEAAVCR